MRQPARAGQLSPQERSHGPAVGGRRDRLALDAFEHAADLARVDVAEPIIPVFDHQLQLVRGLRPAIGRTPNHVEPRGALAGKERAIELEHRVVRQRILQPRRFFRRDACQAWVEPRQQLAPVFVPAIQHTHGVTRALEPRVQRVDAPHPCRHLVGGRVVARDDHLEQQIAHRRRQPQVRILKHAGAVAQVRAAQRHPLVEVQLALLGQLEGANHDRDLDDALTVEGFVGANRGLYAGLEIFHIDAGPGGKPIEFRFERERQGRLRCLSIAARDPDAQPFDGAQGKQDHDAEM